MCERGGEAFFCKREIHCRHTFPDVVEAEFLRPNPDHPPCVEQDDRNRHGVEHGLRGQTEAFLDVPKAENPQRLGCDADDEQVGQVQSIVGNDGVLQGADDGDGGVERVA